MTTIFVHLFEKRLRICGMIAAFAMAASFAGAQSPAPRILSEITSSAQTQLKGSRHPQAQPQNDAGRMPADRQLSGITMYFNRTAAQQADLDALIEAQQDPASPLYHQWLTPDEFAARFGMAESDLDKVQNWLLQQGFAIDSVSRSRNAIRFSGSVGQVELAFGTQMHFFQAGGVKHFAPATELSLPVSIAAAVATVRNLSDFRPRAQHVVPRGSFTSQFTSGQSGNVFFAPGDIATTYDVKPLYSAGVDGTGQTIVIAGQSAVQVSDVENFQSAAGLTKKDPQLVLMPGTGSSVTSAGDQGESDLDLEWSAAMAPGANIVFIYTGSNTLFGVYDSIQYAVDEKIGQIISLSYASCETEITATDLTSLEGMFSQAAAQGQTVISASGDQGSTACSGDTHLTTAQQQAIAVNYPASSAYVTGMGGTEIITANSTSSNSTYWIAASGTDVLSSAKTWIPEVVWNDNSTQFGLSATGGGTSALVSRPSWQTGLPGIASGSFRLVPDISLYSSPGLPGYLYCTSDTSNWNTTSAPIQTASCNSGFRDLSTGELTVAGGTSFAAPIFAGMLALINQKASYVTGQGLVNPTLYKLAATSATYASAFHDVTSGNNNCSVGGTICGSTTTGFSAGTGYDEVTGLGSVDLNNLATAWPVNTGTSAGLKSTTTTVVPANATPAVNVADAFTITVAQVSGTGTPTGSVTLQIDGGTTFGGTTVTGQTLTANGTVAYSATFTTSGTHQVLAQYLGDATHAPSTGVGSVSIAAPTPKGSFTMSATPLTVAQGSSGASTITVTPAGGYLGTVNLTFTTSNNTALTNLCYSFVTNVASGGGSVAVTGTTAVTTQLTLDARASDCVTAAAVTKTGKRPLRIVSGGNRSKNTGTNSLPAELAFAGLLLAGFLGRSSRKFRNLACVMALAAAGFALTACGSSSTTSTSATNPPKGTYTITVTGTDSVLSTITANTTFNFTIN